MHSELIRALENAGSPSILVVGDLMLDRYIWGDVDRVSPEAPVPVVQLDPARAHATVGGAGSVIRDLVALGARVWAAGVVGNDAEGAEILKTLQSEGVDTSLVIQEPGRPTTQKTRVLSKSQHLLRLDSEKTRPLAQPDARRMLDGVLKGLKRFDAVILSDYDKGVLSPEIVSGITSAARSAGKPVWADPARGRDFTLFKGVSAITPNRRETEDATRLRLERGVPPREAADKLISMLGLDVTVVTLDSEGLYYRTASGAQELMAARARAAYDVTGAGDMVIAAAVFGIAAGMPLRTALLLANFAAGMEVERIGVQPLPRREILRRLYDEANITSEKFRTLEELKSLLEEHRIKGEKAVFTNGCFDLLHVGHIKYLQFARSQGDFLIVGLNSDSSVAKLKGPGRPVLPQNERAAILAALSCVDYVVIFEEETPAALINQILPDILVKGEDWREKGVVGRETVELRGGKVILAPLVPGLSTSSIVQRILDAYPGGNKSE